MLEKSICPNCGFPNCYIGIIFVECYNADCVYYTEAQKEYVKNKDKKKEKNVNKDKEISVMLKDFIDADD